MSQDQCPVCQRYINDTDPSGIEAEDGQRWCLLHAPRHLVPVTSWNRDGKHTAVERNLDAAPYGFRVTGDAALFPDSTDFAMFSTAGNQAVRAMVDEILAKIPTFATIEEAHAAITKGCKAVADAGHDEVSDTMVQETICYALDAAVILRFGQPLDQEAI